MALRNLLPKRVSRHRILGGPLRGMRLYGSWYNYPRAILGSAEKELLAWFTRNVEAGETWIDVGAHYGYTSLALSRQVGESGRVFACEPALGTAGCLALTREANGLKQMIVAPFALGDVTTLSFQGSLEEYLGMARIDPAAAARRAAADRGHPAYMVALDWAWPMLCGGDERISGIKIDVQGDEAAVLRGMKETLRAQRPKLVVEYHGNADLDEVLNALESAGYSRLGLDIDSGASAETDRLVHGHNYHFRLRRNER
jgi:FkbM family methyltransferase